MVRPMILFLLLACRSPDTSVACNDYCAALDPCAEREPGARWDGCVGWCQADHAAADFVACMDEAYPTDGLALTGEDCNEIFDACLSSGALPPDMAE